MVIRDVADKAVRDGQRRQFRLAVPVTVVDSANNYTITFVVIKTLNQYIKEHPSFKPIKKIESDEHFVTITQLSFLNYMIDLAIPIRLSREIKTYGDSVYAILYALNEKLKELTSSKSVVEL